MSGLNASVASKLSGTVAELLRQAPGSSNVVLTKCLQSDSAGGVAPVASESTVAWAKATQPLFARDEDADGSVAIQVREAELFATVPRVVRDSIALLLIATSRSAHLPHPLYLSLLLARNEQDLLSDTEALEAVGASLGEEEMMRIFLSIARLSTGKGLGGEDPAAPAVASLRFWGVIRARKATYYIVEGAGASPEEPEDAAGDWDETLNTSKFWASTGLSGAWIELPDVRPSQIASASKLRRFFVGDLDAPVASYPPFVGAERVLLRAQIARISSFTSVSPMGCFAADGEAGPEAVDPAELTRTLAAAALADAANWAHHAPEISALTGKTTVPVAPEEEEAGDESEGAPSGAKVAAQPSLRAPLASLAGDAAGDWSFRVRGDTVCVRCNAWPGAIAVASTPGKAWINFYDGNGTAANSSAGTFTPAALPGLAIEGVEGEEGVDLLEDPTPPPAEEEEDGE